MLAELYLNTSGVSYHPGKVNDLRLDWLLVSVLVRSAACQICQL